MEDTRRLDLMLRAQAGDADAYALLLQDQSPRITGALRRRVPARLRSKVDVDDLVQSAFRETIEQFPNVELRDSASLGRYLTVVAERRLSRAIARFGSDRRSVKREVRIEASDPSSTFGTAMNPAATGPGPATSAEAAEARRRIQTLLEELPEALRTVLRLEMAGCDGIEIAHILNKPESTIRTWRQKARTHIHRRLRAQESGEPEEP